VNHLRGLASIPAKC